MGFNFDSIGTFIFNYRFVLLIIGIIVLMIVFAKLSRMALKRHFRKGKLEGFDQTNFQFINNGISFIFLLIGLILIFTLIPELKAIGLTLFAGAGIFAAIVGFASQAAFANIISGIFIVIFKPFRIGDILKLPNIDWGEVEDITLRHTVILTFQSERYVIPNSMISSESILNASINDSKVRIWLEMGISYDSNVDLAMQIMAEEAEKHPNIIDNRKEEEIKANQPLVPVRLISYGDSSVNLRAYIWAANFMSGFIMKTDLLKSVKKRFDAEGIEIPFPHRTIVYKNGNEK